MLESKHSHGLVQLSAAQFLVQRRQIIDHFALLILKADLLLSFLFLLDLLITDSYEDLFKGHVADAVAPNTISFKVGVHLLEDVSKVLRHVISQFVNNFSGFVDLHCNFLIRTDSSLFLDFFNNSSARLALIMIIALIILL